jgi:hypothetical protein
MQKVDLKKVLDMLINEEQDKAESLLHQWFVQKTKAIHENLMQDDDVLENDIEDDQDEVDSEEFYGEAEGSEDEDSDDSEVDAMAADDAESDLDSPDMADDVPGGNDDPFSGSEDDIVTDPAEIMDQFDDLQSDLARLKAEFEQITGASSDDMGDASTTLPPDADAGNMAGDDLDAAVDDEPAEGFTQDEEVPFNESDYADLDESFELEKVTPQKLEKPTYSGTGGSAGTVNDKSLISGKNKPDVYAHDPIEFGGEDKPKYLGDDTPEYKKAPLRKNQVKNAEDDLEKVPAMGPKNALLNNKGEGYEQDKVNNFFAGGRKVSESKKKTGKVSEARYESDLQDHEPRYVHGVRGAESKKFKKKFRNQKDMEKWMDAEGDNHEIHQVSRD